MFKRLSSLPRHLRRFPEIGRCLIRCHSPLKWIYSYVGGGAVAFPCDFTTRDGDCVQLRDWADLTTVWRVLLADEYQIPAGAMRIIDAGANIGAFSVLAARKRPAAEIIALEPFPQTHTHLLATLERNQLSDRVVAIQAALAGVDGEVSFDADPATNSYSRRIVANANGPTIQVPALSIGAVMSQQGWDVVDYLKMDIEGGEYAVFKDVEPGHLQKVNAIGLEYHDESKWSALKERLLSHGYECVAHRPEGWSGLAEFRRIRST